MLAIINTGKRPGKVIGGIQTHLPTSLTLHGLIGKVASLRTDFAFKFVFFKTPFIGVVLSIL